MSTKVWTQALMVCCVSTWLVGCSQPLSTREKGTLAGAGLGAATGAVIGSAAGKPGAGAAIGGALGGVTGALGGGEMQAQEKASEEQGRALEDHGVRASGSIRRASVNDIPLLRIRLRTERMTLRAAPRIAELRW